MNKWCFKADLSLKKRFLSNANRIDLQTMGLDCQATAFGG